MNLSWKKTALAGTALLVIPLFHFLTHSDKEPVSEGVEDAFVQETEQLIAELEQLGKDIPQSPHHPLSVTRTGLLQRIPRLRDLL